MSVCKETNKLAAKSGKIRKHDYPYWSKIMVLLALLIIGFFVSFWIGRYDISVGTVWEVLVSNLLGTVSAIDETIYTVVMQVRLPRIIIAILVGGALSVSGASYQTLFKNPMVSPDLLGVSAGAGFGAALAMINDCTWWQIQVFAFVFGILAVTLTNFISRLLGGKNITVLILAGVVMSSLFQALLSIVKTLADTEDALPAITFWLMGSLGKTTLQDIGYLLPTVFLGLLLVFLFRHQINTLAAGADEAESMGVNVRLVKLVIIVSSTMMTVCAVSICGIIGWVGLVIPHIARMLVGADFGKIAATSFLSGGIFLLMVDNIVRGVQGAELPLGVITALVGTPVFVCLLYKARRSLS